MWDRALEGVEVLIGRLDPHEQVFPVFPSPRLPRIALVVRIRRWTEDEEADRAPIDHRSSEQSSLVFCHPTHPADFTEVASVLEAGYKQQCSLYLITRDSFAYQTDVVCYLISSASFLA